MDTKETATESCENTTNGTTIPNKSIKSEKIHQNLQNSRYLKSQNYTFFSFFPMLLAYFKLSSKIMSIRIFFILPSQKY